MPVPSLPFSLSDVNSEFGSKSLATHFSDGDGGVGSLPGSLSEFEGLSDEITLVSVTATNVSNPYEDTPSSSFVSGVSTVTTSPADDGSVSYSWAKLSGDTIDNVGEPNRTFSDTLSDGQSVSATYRVTASNSNGSVTDDITVFLSYTDTGS